MDENTIYYVIGSVSITLSLYVVLSIFRYELFSHPIKLILYLHLTVILESFTVFPHIFNQNRSLCSLIGFLRLYSGLSNTIVLTLLVFHYRFLFHADVYKVSRICSKYKEVLIFVFPLITLLPFLTNSYGEDNGKWCNIKSDGEFFSRFWIIVVFYGWLAIFIFGSALLLIHTIFFAFLADPKIAGRLFQGIGVYALTTLVCWIPRGLVRCGVVSEVNSNVFVFISELVYCLIFFVELEVWKKFENNMIRGMNSECSQSTTYSWGISPFESDPTFSDVRRSLNAMNQDRTSERISNLSDRISIPLGMNRKSVRMSTFAADGQNTDILSSSDNEVNNNTILQIVESPIVPRLMSEDELRSSETTADNLIVEV